LLESILEPSRKIEPEFVSHVLLTLDGNLITGLKLQQDTETITLRSVDGKTHVIPLEDVESVATQATSLMPTGLAADMTASQLADLLAFLLSLK
jgi:putative heme-binding domain-containing protein